MITLTIPEYRLPKNIIKKEIQDILDYGIKLKLNSPISSEKDIAGLFKKGFNSVFISIGSFKSKKLNIPGEQFKNISHGVDFLYDIKKGKKKSVKDDVIVIGGGNVAIDCARAAIRLGAKNVSIVYRRSKSVMPALEEEVNYAIEEGIKIYDYKTPLKISGKDGKFSALEVVDTKLSAAEDRGSKVEIVPGTEKLISGNELVIAVGQSPGLGFLEEKSKIKITKWGTIDIDEKTMMTSWKGVFAGGDVVSGAASIIEAIADGQRAAESIDAYIKGKKYEPELITEQVIKLSSEELKQRKEKKIERLEMPAIPIKKRAGSFKEVELGFTEEIARKEAQRCFNCAICSYCKQCKLNCEAEAILYNDESKQRE